MIYVLAIILLLVFFITFLFILATMIVIGAAAGVIFIYVRSGMSYLNSVREEVTNPVAKTLTMIVAGIVVFLPVLFIISMIIMGFVGAM